MNKMISFIKPQRHQKEITRMTDIITMFDKLFNEKKFHRLARQKQFVKRESSKLQGPEYIKTMVLLRSGTSEESLNHLCRQIKKLNPEADISPQALAKRINSKESVSLVKAVFAEILNCLRSSMVKSFSPLKASLNMFSRVIIQDSTTITLNEKLRNDFRGTNRGGTAGKSQLKIDLLHDVKHDQMIDASIYDGNKPDQGLSSRATHFLEERDLIIRDLGYFSTSAFESIDEMGAYFLSRINANVNIYLSRDDKKPLDLGDYLRKNHKTRSVIDLQVFLGKKKQSSRLVIYRQSEQITNRRLRVLHKNRRKQEETLSANRKTLASFSIFVTNVPEELFPATVVGTIYRLRWEIELIFKQWKSQLKIHILKGINPNRIETLIWSRLSTVLLMSLVQGIVSERLENSLETEISPTKLINYLKFDNMFFIAVIESRLDRLISILIEDLNKICKDKRRRKTMRERIRDGEDFYQCEALNFSGLQGKFNA